MSKQGIDISAWQGDIDLSAVPCDFVIIKATEGVSYISPSFEGQYNQSKSLGKMTGIYHFASGRQTGKSEADYFLGVIGNRYKDAFLVLDWEEFAINMGVGYAKEFLDRVKKVTGKAPLIYMSAGVTRSYDWSSVAKTYPLWVAQYGSDDFTGYQDYPWNDGLGYGAWAAPHIFQYSNHGRLPGYGASLDINIMYKEPNVSTNTSKDKPKKKYKTLTKAQMNKLVDEVIAGKWGNGEERIQKLEAKGYDSAAVQRQVNKKLASSGKSNKKKSVTAVAKEVIAGKWGNGAERKKNLEQAGYDYNKVQNKVNELLGQNKSIDEVAQEVIRGEWGNGNERKIRLEQAGYDYNTIQNKVNELM